MQRKKQNTQQQGKLQTPNENFNNKLKEKRDPYLIPDKKTHIPYLLARSTNPLPQVAPRPILTPQQLKERQLANSKHNWQILTKFGIFSCMMLLTPLLSFYGFQYYAASNYPLLSTGDRATYGGIISSISVFIVMTMYIIIALREKIDE